MIKNIYKVLKKEENNGRKIGIFRILCAIFGGFVVSYLAMTFLALVLPFKIENSAVLSLLYTTLMYSITAIYITISRSKLIALNRVLAPSLVFSILIYILY